MYPPCRAKLMRVMKMRHKCTFGVILLAIITSRALAQKTLEDFETGAFPSGWTTIGNAWTVGGETHTNPDIAPPQGSYFARSGAPNTSSEANTGTVTSSAYVVSYDTLTWKSVGWDDGPNTYDGTSYFQILNSNFQELARIPTAQADIWKSVGVNLRSLGLNWGDTFYFRAIDARAQSTYSWLAFDALTLTGVVDGDYNGNGVVDAADYVMWRKDPSSFGGDPTGYNAWRANFGQLAGSSSDSFGGLSFQSAVPEPDSALLLIIGIAIGTWRRGRISSRIPSTH
jgi:hypothetical protein